MYRIYIKWVLGKINEIPCVGLALECLVDHWSNPLPFLPPQLATSPPSQRNLPRHSLALVEDARKIGAGPWLCIIKTAPLYMSLIYCKISPVIITSEKSRFNHSAKPMLDISEAGLDLGCHKVLTGLLPITACSESHSCFNPAWPAQFFFWTKFALFATE